MAKVRLVVPGGSEGVDAPAGYAGNGWRVAWPLVATGLN